MTDVLPLTPALHGAGEDLVRDLADRGDLVWRLRRFFANCYAAGYAAGHVAGTIETHNDVRQEDESAPPAPTEPTVTVEHMHLEVGAAVRNALERAANLARTEPTGPAHPSPLAALAERLDTLAATEGTPEHHAAVWNRASR